jgi:hypothetical protein
MKVPAKCYRWRDADNTGIYYSRTISFIHFHIPFCSYSSGTDINRLYRVAQLPVGASLLAMDVNDYAGILNARGAHTFFASRLAPTKIRPA